MALIIGELKKKNNYPQRRESNRTGSLPITGLWLIVLAVIIVSAAATVIKRTNPLLQSDDKRELLISTNVLSSINSFIKNCLQLRSSDVESSLYLLDAAIVSTNYRTHRTSDWQINVKDNILIKNTA
jgi:hypothetical protein